MKYLVSVFLCVLRVPVLFCSDRVPMHTYINLTHEHGVHQAEEQSTKTLQLSEFVNTLDARQNTLTFGGIEDLPAQDRTHAPLKMILDEENNVFKLRASGWFRGHLDSNTGPLDPLEKFIVARAHYDATHTTHASCLWRFGWHPEISVWRQKLGGFTQLFLAGALLGSSALVQYSNFNPIEESSGSGQQESQPVTWLPPLDAYFSGVLSLHGLECLAYDYGFHYYSFPEDRNKVESVFAACKTLNQDELKAFVLNHRGDCDQVTDNLMCRLNMARERRAR